MSDLLLAKVILAVTLVSAGVVQVWLARATASGRVGRNPLAGIRTKATMASDEAWLAAHRAARSPMETCGWCTIAAGLLGLVAPSMILLIAVAVTGTVLALVLIATGAVRGSRAARKVADAQPDLST